MGEEIVWVHLSDFHISDDLREEDRHDMFKLKEHMSDKLTHMDLNPDFIFITGDIANKGNPKHFNTVLNILFDHTDRKKNGFFDGIPYKNIVQIPGNHDGLWVKKSTNIINKLNPHDFSKYPLNKYAEVEGRYENFRTYLAKSKPYTNKSNGPVDVAVIRLNTGLLCTEKRKDNLSFGKERYFQLKNNLQTGKNHLNLVLMHHPLEDLISEEQVLVKEDMTEFDIILCGHKHKTSIGVVNNHLNIDKSLLIFSSGKLKKASEANEYRSYNIVKTKRRDGHDKPFWLGVVFFYRYEETDWVDCKVCEYNDRNYRLFFKYGKNTKVLDETLRDFVSRKLVIQKRKKLALIWYILRSLRSNKSIREVFLEEEILNKYILGED